MVAYEVGCTFGIGLFKKLYQPFFMCKTCNDKVDDEAMTICIICAIFCHRGHNV